MAGAVMRMWRVRVWFEEITMGGFIVIDVCAETAMAANIAAELAFPHSVGVLCEGE
jgi:hypothetical protein